ncbi:MAG: TolC family protein [Candidatus Zixiibacteriota bacterium]|nr:MAG: TolC family protein [candidate division Zixibacteria bacterium]
MKRIMTGYAIVPVVLLAALLLVAGTDICARELTWEQALRIAVDKSSRGEIIEGDLEVAEQNYFAEKINFFVPEISINGNAPVYNVSESFRFFGGLNEKQLIRTTDRDFKANIQLNQSLFTGGNLSVVGNLWNRRSEYPLSGIDVTEVSNQGVFDFTFQQPLLKPSEPKNNLRNRQDELEIARFTRVQELAKLKKEVTDAYLGVLQSEIQLQIAEDKAESARLKVDIDSVKFLDGVISEEDWLLSRSSRLDAQLALYDSQNSNQEKEHELALLLDFDITEEITPSVPEVTEHIEETRKTAFINNWEESIPIKKAWHEYRKAKRLADYTASSHGLTGTFEASYSLGRGDVEVEGITEDNDTDSWQLAVNFRLPLWDGGSTGASIKAARITAQKSEIEYQRARKSARAEIVALINQLDISDRKLRVLQQQVDIARDKLDIAQFRLDDGQISTIEFLEGKVFYLEAQNNYLEELRNYLDGRIEIESKYIS